MELVRGLVSLLGWIYLIRGSLLGLAGLLGLPLLARGGGRALCIGTFDVHSLTGAVVVGLLLPVAAYAVFLTAMLTLSYGQKRMRFQVTPPPGWFVPAFRITLWAAFALNVWTIAAATDTASRLGTIGALAGGLVIGLGAVWKVELDHRIECAPWPSCTPFFFPCRLFPGGPTPTLGLPGAAAAHDGWDWLARGYRGRNAKKNWAILPGHLLAVKATLFFLVLNWNIYRSFHNMSEELTPLVYLLVMLVSAVLALSGLAFLVDAYRVPVLTVLALWLYAVSYSPNADHFYRIWPREDGRARRSRVATPGDVLEAAGKAGRPIVLVAIAGGGIQSAAWSTRVLTGLEQVVLDAQKQPEFGPALPDFTGSIQCLSGVSGGSVGAMFFVAGYGQGGLPEPRPTEQRTPLVDASFLPKIVAAAEETSLGQSVWGLAYSDFLRAWLPFLCKDAFDDRATRMETKWAANASMHMGPLGNLLEDRSLADWQDDVRRGKRPAIIFNATIVETGERLSFSTAPPIAKSEGQREFITRYDDGEKHLDLSLYPRADVRLTTAARLSATFPFVSPSGRPRVAPSRWAPAGPFLPTNRLAKLVPGEDALRHVVDGGYYDNTGLGALAQWLDDGLTELDKRGTLYWPKSVLIIELNAFPDPPTSELLAPKPESVPPMTQPVGDRGAFFQLGSPLSALYQVRGAGHTAAADHAFDMLQQRWLLDNPLPEPAKGTPTSPHHRRTPATCTIEHVRFTIPLLPPLQEDHTWWQPAWASAKADSPPLSWHLRQPEKDGVDEGWRVLTTEWQANPRSTGMLLDQFFPSMKMGPQDVGAWPVDNVLKFLKTAPAPVPLKPRAARTSNPAPQPQ